MSHFVMPDAFKSGKIAGALRAFTNSTGAKNEYPLAALMPFAVVDSDTVKLDITTNIGGGMTYGSTPGAPSEIVDMSISASQVSFEAVEFREKMDWSAFHARDVRLLGTDSEDIPPEFFKSAMFNTLQDRLMSRQEWLRANALFNEQVVHYSGNIATTIPYSHPSQYKFTAGTSWAVASTDIMADIKTLLSDDTAQIPRAGSGVNFICAGNIRSMIEKNTALQTLLANKFQYNPGPPMVNGLWRSSPNAAFLSPIVEAAVQALVGDGITFTFYTKTLDSTTFLTDAASTGQAVVYVNSTENIRAGTKLSFKDSTSSSRQWIGTVSSVNHTTKAVTLTANLLTALAEKTHVLCQTKIVPDDKFIMLPTYDVNAAVGGSDEIVIHTNEVPVNDNTLGRVISTRNKYLPNDRSPGIFTWNYTHGDPPVDYFVLGAMMLPRIDYHTKYILGDVTP